MPTTASTSIQGRHTYVENMVFGGTGALTSVSPAADGTAVLSGVVPADGAEVVACTFTITTAGAVTTSGTQQWAVSDGTNNLWTMAATSSAAADTVIGTVRTMTIGTATNGRAIATTAGSRLILTNTEAGTVGTAVAGIFRVVWAL